MNKKLLILPVISALLLAGCTMGRTTKKKKKSSSVDVTSQSVTPTPTSGTPAPAPTSATPAPTPTSATPAPTPTSGTPAPTPTSGTSVVPPTPGADWSEAQKTAMLENIGFVPEYMAGLDAAEYDSEYYEYWVIVDNDVHASYEAILLAKGWTASEENPLSGSFEDGTAYTGYEYLKDSGTVDPESGKEVYFVSSMLVYDDEGIITQFEWYAATDGEGGGGGDVPPAGESITISLEDIASTLGSSIYASADYSFTTDGVSFNATAGVGQKTANGSGQGNYYNEQGLMQFRKANHANGGGVVTVAEAVSKSTITVHWYATYATEDSQYHPVVKVGDSADAVSTSVACNEGTTLTGTLVEGVKEYSGNQDRDVYAYTTTYTISGHSYFSIGAPNSATYIKDIVIS
ncbi:MAG: hypothetical protein SPL75_03450 [Bacilli bacterium]|nr:hypothetical protein [Bacilli bacterium]